MAKKKTLIYLGLGAAALYLLSKKGSNEEFKAAGQKNLGLKSGEVKPLAVNTPVTPTNQARPALFNPVNNALNAATNILQPRKIVAQKIVLSKPTRRGTADIGNVIY